MLKLIVQLLNWVVFARPREIYIQLASDYWVTRGFVSTIAHEFL